MHGDWNSWQLIETRTAELSGEQRPGGGWGGGGGGAESSEISRVKTQVHSGDSGDLGFVGVVNERFNRKPAHDDDDLNINPPTPCQ